MRALSLSISNSIILKIPIYIAPLYYAIAFLPPKERAVHISDSGKIILDTHTTTFGGSVLLEPIQRIDWDD
jgi:hypothetical protein